MEFRGKVLALVEVSSDTISFSLSLSLSFFFFFFFFFFAGGGGDGRFWPAFACPGLELDCGYPTKGSTGFDESISR